MCFCDPAIGAAVGGSATFIPRFEATVGRCFQPLRIWLQPARCAAWALLQEAEDRCDWVLGQPLISTASLQK